MAEDISRPLIVGIGGTTSAVSSTERALAVALRAAAGEGADTQLFGGEALAALPLYTPNITERSAGERSLVEAIRRASGVIIASPGYHGSISGLEETAKDQRIYLTDLPVGLIATAYGWQATGSTIAALRSIVHALRGWPTPLGAAINSAQCKFGDDGGCSDPAAAAQLATVGRQVAQAALRDQRARRAA